MLNVFFRCLLEELGSDWRSNLERATRVRASVVGLRLTDKTTTIRAFSASLQPTTYRMDKATTRRRSSMRKRLREVEADSRRRIGPINWRLKQPLHWLACCPVQQER